MIGFPLATKTRYNPSRGKPAKPLAWPYFHRHFPPQWLFEPKRAIGWAKFRAYMLQTHP
jgi:hypothetical protein